jgi:PTH1 family peptidyl-tRNA hydrolase
VLDLLAERAGGRFKAHKGRADLVEGRLGGVRAVLAKPRSYMNESGGPVAGLRDFFKITPDRLVVVHDELDLPYGTLRLKLGGGDNGHNGLRSIGRSLGTRDSSGSRYTVYSSG